MNNTPNTTPSLGDLLLTFRRNIIERFRKEGLKEDLTFSQVEVLNFITPIRARTMKDIAEHLKITPPSATEIVKEMEKKKLVKRKNDTKDRRIVYIALSPPGKGLYTSLCKHKESILKEMTSKLNQKDKASLERIIKILITPEVEQGSLRGKQ